MSGFSMFSPDGLAQALSGIPPTNRGAVVATVDTEGAKVLVALGKSNGGPWQVQAVVEHDWTGDNKAGARVLLSW